MVEVLALEEDPGSPGVLGEAPHLGEGAGAPGVVDEQTVQFGGEGRVGLGLVVLDGDLVHGGDQRLRDEFAAEGAEVAPGIGAEPLGVGKEVLAGHDGTPERGGRIGGMRGTASGRARARGGRGARMRRGRKEGAVAELSLSGTIACR